jgi:hypothetical protein
MKVIPRNKKKAKPMNPTPVVLALEDISKCRDIIEAGFHRNCAFIRHLDGYIKHLKKLIAKGEFQE